jgi:hypothetical protein
MDSRNAENRKYDQLWTHRGNKFVIGTLHGAPVEIIAQYNPKELSRQAAATWTPHPNTSARYSENGESKMWAQYATTAPRSMTLELLFDGYEEGKSIAPIVADLERLTIPVDMSSRDETKRRPQLCVAVWGTQQLRCVVTSVATKLTMFDESGEPLRASCTVVLTEVDVVAMLNRDVSGTIKGIAAKGGGYHPTKRDHTRNPYPPEDSKPTRVPRTADPTASDITSARGSQSSSNESAPAGSTAAKSPAPAPAPTPAPAAPATGTPSAQVDPSAMDGEGDHVFVGDQPVGEQSAPQTGTPSAQVDPNAMDGESDHVFVGEQPAPQTGTPSAQVDPNAMDGEGDHVFVGEQPAPDAVSSADPAGPNAKTKALYDHLE